VKNYNEILQSLEEQLIDARDEASELADKLALLRLEMKATKILVTSQVKNLEVSLPMLLALAHEQLLKTSWDNCLAIMKSRRSDLW